MPHKDPEVRKRYRKAYYDRTYGIDPEFRQRQKDQVKSRKRSIQDWYLSLKSEQKYMDCGEDHPACLEYHHRDPSTKDADIAQAALQLGWSKDRILAEIKKCDCICCNCHRKRHYNDALATLRQLATRH